MPGFFTSATITIFRRTGVSRKPDRVGIKIKLVKRYEKSNSNHKNLGF